MAGNTLCPSAAMVIGLIIDELSDDAQNNLTSLAKAHQDFVHFANQFPATRERALAITNAEQAFMWALKGIADDVLKQKDQE